MTRAVVLAVLALGPALGQGIVEGHGTARRFVSRKYGFSMAVPVRWGVSIALDTPVFFYAPRSARFMQDQIPGGGAVITTEPHDRASRRRVETPEAWAVADMRAEASGSRPIEEFQFPPESQVQHAVMCAYMRRSLACMSGTSIP